MTTIRGIRLDVDGALTDLELPHAYGLVEALRPAVAGWVEIAHYARPDRSRSLSVALNSDGPVLCQPNLYVTALVSAVRLGHLPHLLYGPAVLLGALDQANEHTDVPEWLNDQLPPFVAALRTRYATTTTDPAANGATA